MQFLFSFISFSCYPVRARLEFKGDNWSKVLGAEENVFAKGTRGGRTYEVGLQMKTRAEPDLKHSSSNTGCVIQYAGNVLRGNFSVLIGVKKKRRVDVTVMEHW